MWKFCAFRRERFPIPITHIARNGSFTTSFPARAACDIRTEQPQSSLATPLSSSPANPINSSTTAPRTWFSTWWRTIPSVSRFIITTARNGRCARPNVGFFAVNRWSITKVKSDRFSKDAPNKTTKKQRKEILMAGIPDSTPKTIVLVHGGFVDGSGWEEVYKVLKKDGYIVSIVQNPTMSLEDDVAVTKR